MRVAWQLIPAFLISVFFAMFSEPQPWANFYGIGWPTYILAWILAIIMMASRVQWQSYSSALKSHPPPQKSGSTPALSRRRDTLSEKRRRFQFSFLLGLEDGRLDRWSGYSLDKRCVRLGVPGLYGHCPKPLSNRTRQTLAGVSRLWAFEQVLQLPKIE